MKIRLVCVGKMSKGPLQALAEDYRKRLERLCELDIVEVKDGDEKDGAKRLAREGERIRIAAEPLSECILWDEGGESLGSREFSQWIDKLENKSTKRLTLIIGSSHGIADALKAAIPRKLQLSGFTLTHEWARALALEQLYRAYCIKKKIPYHH